MFSVRVYTLLLLLFLRLMMEDLASWLLFLRSGVHPINISARPRSGRPCDSIPSRDLTPQREKACLSENHETRFRFRFRFKRFLRLCSSFHGGQVRFWSEQASKEREGQRERERERQRLCDYVQAWCKIKAFLLLLPGFATGASCM